MESLDESEFLINEKAFNATTGSTHGIRFKIRPPKNANKIAVKKLIWVFANEADSTANVLSIS